MIIFFLIIGSYWFLGLIKDTVFFKLAFPTSLGWPEGYGRLMQPIAKTISPLIVLGFVLCSTYLVDHVKKTSLFYIFGTLFIISFASMGLVMWARTSYGEAAVGSTVLAATGWLGFFLADAFGSLMTTLFWSLAVSVTTVDEAKKGFPLIIAGAQCGSISGSLLTIVSQKFVAIWPLYLIGCILIGCMMLALWRFHRLYTVKEERAMNPSKKDGLLAGIRLLLNDRTMQALFIISTIYEFPIAIIDYQMKTFLDISNSFIGEIGFSTFMGLYGAAVNTCAFLIALLGSRWLLGHIGVRRTVFIYPFFIAIGLITLIVVSKYSFNTDTLLWLTLSILVLAKGITYGLHNPTRDIFYIPTSPDARFKTKNLIETVGSRSMIMTGSAVSNILKHNIMTLTLLGSSISLGVVGFWLVASWYLARHTKVS